MGGGKRKWGLVLGGGAVRGIAHLGVLQVLTEAGLTPDLVVGVSAGSLAGGVYCAGVSVQRMEDLARDLRWRKITRLVRPRWGLVDMAPLRQLVRQWTAGAWIEDLRVPFVAVAADIQAACLVPLAQGPLADAIVTSCAVPGIVCPVEKDGRLLVDGGVLNDLPVSLTRQMGIDVVVAVNLLPPPTLPAERPRNLLEMWSLLFHTLIRVNRVDEGANADVDIVPDVGDASFLDFRQTDMLLHKGRQAAERALPAIFDVLASEGTGDLRNRAWRAAGAG